DRPAGLNGEYGLEIIGRPTTTGAAAADVDQEIADDPFVVLKSFVRPFPGIDKVVKIFLQGLELFVVDRRREPVRQDRDISLQFLRLQGGCQDTQGENDKKKAFTHTIRFTLPL